MNEESRPDQWVTIAEAARILGLPKGYVRRMALRLANADRTLSPDGWTRVRLEALQELNAATENDPQAGFSGLYGRDGANTVALIAHLQEEIAFLWSELERRNQAEAELRQLMLLDRRELMELRQRVAHLEAAPESPAPRSEQSPENTAVSGGYTGATEVEVETPVYGYEERREDEEIIETVSLAQDALPEPPLQEVAEEPAAIAAEAEPASPEPVIDEPVAAESPEPVRETPMTAQKEPDDMVSAALRDLDEAIRSITEGLPDIPASSSAASDFSVPLRSPERPAVSRPAPPSAEPVNHAVQPRTDIPAEQSAGSRPMREVVEPPAHHVSTVREAPVALDEPDPPLALSNSMRLDPLDHEMSDILIPRDSRAEALPTALAPTAEATQALDTAFQPMVLEGDEDEELEYRNGAYTAADIPRADATKLPRIPINVETGLDRSSAGIDYVGLAALLQEHRNKVQTPEPEPEPAPPPRVIQPAPQPEKELPRSDAPRQSMYSSGTKVPNSPVHMPAGETDAFLSIEEPQASESASRPRAQEARSIPLSAPFAQESLRSKSAREGGAGMQDEEPARPFIGTQPVTPSRSPDADKESLIQPADARSGRKWWQFWKK